MSIGIGITVLKVCPTHTPWWIALTVTVLSGVFLIPSALLMASAKVNIFDSAITWNGALRTGGNNLSNATNGIYISFIFMYWIKHRYNARWEKYNYILDSGFDMGLAISAIIQALAPSFGAHVTLKWWGNTVATAGVDYKSYNQNATLLPIPPVEYFGIAQEEYPMDF